MPIQTTWYAKGLVVMHQPYGTVTEEEMIANIPEALYFLENKTGPLVHFLIDCTELDAMPKLPAFGKMTWYGDPRLGWSVAFGIKKPTMATVATIASQLFRARFRITKDFETALDTLQNLANPPIPDLRSITIPEHLIDESGFRIPT